MSTYFKENKILLCICFVILCLLGFCYRGQMQESEKQAQASITITDSIGRTVGLEKPLKRVCVANAYNTDLTEMIVALGCLDTIVGVDQNILWNSAAFKNKFKKDDLICAREGIVLNYEKIISLKPDALLISSKGSWFDAQEKLSKFGIKVIVIDTHILENFNHNCDVLGKIFGKEERAKEIKDYYNGQLDYVKKQLANIPNRKTIYLECGRPGATTMKGSYFYSLVQYSGGINIMEDAVERHAVPEAAILRNPQYIVKLGDRRWKYSHIPPTEKEVMIIRNEMKSRPGWDEIDAIKNDKLFQLSFFSHCGASKIIGVLYVAKFLYPEYLPDLHPEQAFKLWMEKYLDLKYQPGHTYPPMSLDY